MSHYDQLIQLQNLQRAYRWVQSNPDASYKNLFRDAYSAYAATSDNNIARLRTHLKRLDYHPGHAGKVFYPKPSGILRPVTLLSVNDQIVYQACANLIAERLTPKIRRYHGKSVFGHVYAGKTSAFFYKKWQRQYQAYTNVVKKHINDGYNWVAEFDLTAFYDSIDHHALNHFLAGLGLDNEFCEFFFRCLRKWTSTNWSNDDVSIYHEHGIPQGPLSSGLVAEAILMRFDVRGQRSRRVRYARYVDDIKLFAQSEGQLRQRLIALDLASKEVGLFPQSSKINIRRARDASEEVKQINSYVEPATSPSASQIEIRKRLRILMRRRPLAGQDLTSFRYLIGGVSPHNELNEKLIGILEVRPDLGPKIAGYFERYKKIPNKAAARICNLLTQDWIYHSNQSSLLMATLRNLPEPYRSKCVAYCYNRLLGYKKGYLPPQPTLKAALAIWCIFHTRITYRELQQVVWNEREWWVRQFILPYVDEGHYGRPSLEAFLVGVSQDEHADVARSSAVRLVDVNPAITISKIEAHESARLVFWGAGYLRAIGRPVSLVQTGLATVAHDRYPVSIEWRRLLGADHRQAESFARRARQYFESNSIDEFILQLDSVFDVVFGKLYTLVRPSATRPDYGHALKDSSVNSYYPATCDAFRTVHDLRIGSSMAHPRDRRTGKWNRALKHSDVKHVAPKLRAAFRELRGQGH